MFLLLRYSQYFWLFLVYINLSQTLVSDFWIPLYIDPHIIYTCLPTAGLQVTRTYIFDKYI